MAESYLYMKEKHEITWDVENTMNNKKKKKIGSLHRSLKTKFYSVV